MRSPAAYDSFVDLRGFPSGGASISSRSDTTSPSHQSHYYNNSGFGRNRDQQIFRRAGSDENPRESEAAKTNGNLGFHGNEVVRVMHTRAAQHQWPQQQQRPQEERKQIQQAAFMAHEQSSQNRSYHNSSSSLDWPDDLSSSFHGTAQQNTPQSTATTSTGQFINSSSRNSPSALVAAHSRTSHVNSNNITASQSSSCGSKLHSTSISPSQITTTSSSQSSMRKKSNNSGKGGVVTKLVSYFSATKPAGQLGPDQVSDMGNGAKSPQSVRSPAASQPTVSSTRQSNQHNPNTMGVQFQSLSLTSNQRAEPNSQNIAKQQIPPHSYPPISPSRSNAQSSVSGGESSSYNPTGWPGTVDKRGKTYAMEPSYSESEEGSIGSPRNRMRGGSIASNNSKQSSPIEYPTQQYRPYVTNKRDFSFDGGDSHAELEDWINGDPNSVAKSIGPVDLDEAYEQRGFDAVGNGWREGHRESLANISETKTAADFHLEAALMKTNGTGERRLSQSGPLGRGSLSRPYHLSQNEIRVRAFNKEASQTNGPQQPAFDDEVDFGGTDDEFSPDDYITHQPQHSPNQHYDEEEEFSPDDFNIAALTQPHLRHHLRHQPLNEEALRLNDSRSAPPRPGGNVMLKGYRGFIDKTRDVPNLMDDLESEANTSLGTNAERRALGLSLPPPQPKPRNNNHGRSSPLPPRPSSVASSNVDSGSDVFEGLGSSVPSINSSAVSGSRLGSAVANNILRGSRTSKRGPGLSSQGHKQHQSRPVSNTFGRQVDFVDPALNLSAVTKYSQHDLVDLDDFVDGFDNPPDLSMYCVEPESVRMMVRAFRKMCTMQMEISSCEDTMLSEFEDLVDTKKRFALFEMRSRIMETDIDRGLQRRGGTNIVDDVVLTPYFQALHRIRDAVIVSKAWRDGATPKDVLTAHLLTRRSAKAYFVRRPIKRIRRPGAFYPEYWLEQRTWLDETDFDMMRCQSLGAGTMKGFEMFTIGDCQSILLKMTSENCMQLRRELRSAMVCQIEAEELMQEEIDLDGDQLIVAEAEQLYRDATIEVKQLSMKLVLADRAFSLVRSRMEKLVETIESLLVHMENDDTTPEGASLSGGETDDDDDLDEDREREKLVERAKRAEMSAEIATREILLAKQEAEKMSAEKQREIDDLKKKLAEMETQSQVLATRYSSVLAGSQMNSYLDKIDAKSILEGSFERDMEEANAAVRDRAKMRFRERRGASQNNNNQGDRVQNKANAEDRLDFYSRSLKSVRVDYDC